MSGPVEIDQDTQGYPAGPRLALVRKHCEYRQREKAVVTTGDPFLRVLVLLYDPDPDFEEREWSLHCYVQHWVGGWPEDYVKYWRCHKIVLHSTLDRALTALSKYFDEFYPILSAAGEPI